MFICGGSVAVSASAKSQGPERVNFPTTTRGNLSAAGSYLGQRRGGRILNSASHRFMRLGHSTPEIDGFDVIAIDCN